MFEKAGEIFRTRAGLVQELRILGSEKFAGHGERLVCEFGIVHGRHEFARIADLHVEIVGLSGPTGDPAHLLFDFG